MSIKHIDGFDQYQGQSSAQLLSSLASAGYAVSSGLAMATGRKPLSHALELQVSAGEGGASWSSRSNTIKADLRGVAANSVGRFVAVGDGGTATTTLDGIQWSPLVLGTAKNMTSIECNAGTFIAVGENGTILRSTDGQAWTARIAPNSAANLTDVAWGGGRWVAVGTSGSAGAIFISDDDGLTWGNAAGSQGDTGNLCVFYGDVWMIGTTGGRALTSANANNFVQRAFDGTFTAVNDIAYDNGTWLALSGRHVRRSTDSGLTWATAALNLSTDGLLRSVMVSDGRWIIGGDQCGLWMSDDTNVYVRPNFPISGDQDVFDINISSGTRVGWCLVGSKPTGNPAATAMIFVSLAPPTLFSRTFVTDSSKVVIGFAHRATARGRIFSVAGLFNMDWPAGIKILDTNGASVPIRNTWYYYELVIDKLANTLQLWVNDTLDLTVALPGAAAAMTSYILTWTAENGAVARLDDLYLLDGTTPPGTTLVNRLKPISVPIRMPDQDVDVNWLGSDPGPHWPLIGLLPPTTSSYVRSSTSGEQDLYASSTPLPVGAGGVDMPIIAVGVMALAQKSDLDARQLGLVVGPVANQKEVIDTTLAITTEYSFAVFESGPGDVPWTAANVVTMPFGVTVRP